MLCPTHPKDAGDERAFREKFFGGAPTTVPRDNVHRESGLAQGPTDFLGTDVPGIVGIPEVDQWS
jgi:hypothetical protein